MATTTSNLGLIKPAGTDKIRISQINSNMDTIDAKMGPVGSTPLQTQATNAASSISALQNSLAIISDGDRHYAIAAENYVYVRNHNSLAEGLYIATASIPYNGTLSTSNLTTVSAGGLNHVKTSVNTVFESADTSKYTIVSASIVRKGYLYMLLGEVRCISPVTNGEVGIVKSGMPNVYSGQVFMPPWGAGNSSRDSLGVHYSNTGIYLCYGTAGAYYELTVPMIV